MEFADSEKTSLSKHLPYAFTILHKTNSWSIDMYFCNRTGRRISGFDSQCYRCICVTCCLEGVIVFTRCHLIATSFIAISGVHILILVTCCEGVNWYDQDVYILPATKHSYCERTERIQKIQKNQKVKKSRQSSS